MLRGSVRVDGEAAPGRRVLVVSGDAERLVGSVETGPDGTFAVDVDERPVHLLVKLQGPQVGIVTLEIGLGEGLGEAVDVEIETAGGFHRVTGRITGEHLPPFVLVSLDPVELGGVAPALLRYANRRDERVVEASFFDRQVRDGAFDLLAQAGSYRLRGGYVVKGPVVAGPKADVVVGRVLIDGSAEPLHGDRSSGFDVSIDGPTDLTLELSPAAG